MQTESIMVRSSGCDVIMKWNHKGYETKIPLTWGDEKVSMLCFIDHFLSFKTKGRARPPKQWVVGEGVGVGGDLAVSQAWMTNELTPPSPHTTLSTVQGPARGLSLHARPLFVPTQCSAHFQGLTAFRLLASFGISCFFSQGGVRCDRYIKRVDRDRWLHRTRSCCV